jgi:hypothetical protein
MTKTSFQENVQFNSDIGRSSKCNCPRPADLFIPEDNKCKVKTQLQKENRRLCRRIDGNATGSFEELHIQSPAE